jgi:transcriptional regulator with XRE-family HTH domain
VIKLVYDFGMTLKKLRKKKRLSQEQVAKRLNLTKSSISGYENNVITPSIDTIRAFSMLYGTTSDYLLGLEKKESIEIEGLTPRQKDIIETLILEFKTANAQSMHDKNR